MIDLNVPEIKEFVNYVKTQCKAKGVIIKLKPTKNVKLGEIKCSGYFDEIDKELVVSAKHESALETLVHEFAHFTQWIEDCPAWKASASTYGNIDEWLGGKEFRYIKKYVALARDLELDNEKRSVKLIKKFKLPIDVKLYIKKANAYVLFYNYMLITRRWCKPNNSPSRNPILLAECSDKFDMRYDKLSDDILDAFILAKI